MPTLPWVTPSSPATAPPATDPSTPARPDARSEGPQGAGQQPAVQVMASRFELSSTRETVRMLRHAMAVRRAVLASPGALGVSLIARPLRREYWTLSAWSDRASLDDFVAHPIHRAAMTALGPAMADSAFRFWTQPAATLPPSWDAARAAVGRPSADAS